MPLKTWLWLFGGKVAGEEQGWARGGRGFGEEAGPPAAPRGTLASPLLFLNCLLPLAEPEVLGLYPLQGACSYTHFLGVSI